MNHQRVVSPQLSKVYNHFNYNCIAVHNHFFAPSLIVISEDLKLYLSLGYKEVLIARQISNLRTDCMLQFQQFFVLKVTFLTSKLKLYTFSVAQLADLFKIKNVATMKVKSLMFYV